MASFGLAGWVNIIGLFPIFFWEGGILGQKNEVDGSGIKAKKGFCFVIWNILQSIQKCPELIIREVGIEKD